MVTAERCLVLYECVCPNSRLYLNGGLSCLYIFCLEARSEMVSCLVSVLSQGHAWTVSFFRIIHGRWPVLSASYLKVMPNTVLSRHRPVSRTLPKRVLPCLRPLPQGQISMVSCLVSVLSQFHWLNGALSCLCTASRLDLIGVLSCLCSVLSVNFLKTRSDWCPVLFLSCLKVTAWTLSCFVCILSQGQFWMLSCLVSVLSQFHHLNGVLSFLCPV